MMQFGSVPLKNLNTETSQQMPILALDPLQYLLKITLLKVFFSSTEFDLFLR